MGRAAGLCAALTLLSRPQASVRELMARALQLESQRWAQDVAPQRLDGHCHSELAIDIIQVLRAARCACLRVSALSAAPPCASASPPLVSAHPSPLQIISQGQAKAESITLDLGMQIKHVLLLELAAFLRRWVSPAGACRGGGLGVVPVATSLRATCAPSRPSYISVPFLPLECLSLGAGVLPSSPNLPPEP